MYCRIWASLSQQTHSKDNTGYGATQGKGLWLSDGSYLHKLEKKGLVRDLGYLNRFGQWEITMDGRTALEQNQENIKQGRLE